MTVTPDAVKDIREDMSDRNGKVSLLFMTNAVGLGVNCKNITCVITFSLPQAKATSLQDIDRVGQMGDLGQHPIVFTSKQLLNLPGDMLQYVHSNDTCHREI